MSHILYTSVASLLCALSLNLIISAEPESIHEPPAPIQQDVMTATPANPWSTQKAWETSIGGSSFTSITPVDAGAYILAASSHHVHCLRKSDGCTHWVVEVEGYHHQPLICDQTAIIIERHHARAINIADGKTLWHRILIPNIAPAPDKEPQPISFYGSPARYQDAIIVASRFPGIVMAVDLPTGATLWQQSDESKQKDFFTVTVDEHLGFVSDWNEAVECRSLDNDGELLWRQVVPGVGAGQPIVIQDEIFVVGTSRGTKAEKGHLTVLSRQTGAIIQRIPIDRAAIGTPVILDNIVALSCKTSVIGINRTTWTKVWEVERPRFASENLVVDERGRIYLGGDNGDYMDINGHDGTRLSQVSLIDHANPDGPRMYRYGSITSNEQTITATLGTKHEGEKGAKSQLKGQPFLGQSNAPCVEVGKIYISTASGWLGALKVPGALPAAIGTAQPTTID